jgi:hypothetical protein
MAEATNAKQDAVKQVLDNRRSFIFESPDGKEEMYYIADPSGEDIRKADWNYSKVFNQAMADGFPTQAQMLEVLKQRGIISEDYSSEVEQTRVNLAAALYRLDTLPEDESDAEKEGLALEIAEFRDTLFRLNQRVNGPLGNTCENLAEDARTEYLTSRIIQNKDGKRTWPVFEDYLNESRPGLCVKSRFEVMLWLQGLDSNFLENTPEQTALRSLAQKRLDQALSDMQSKEAEEAKEELSLPDVVEAAPTETAVPKKKAGRPRKTKAAKE